MRQPGHDPSLVAPGANQDAHLAPLDPTAVLEANLKRQLLLLNLLQPEQFTQVVAQHIRTCQHKGSCRICLKANESLTRRRERAEAKKRLEQRRRHLGVLKCVGPLLALRRRATERAYTPGGRGYETACESFQSHQHESSPCLDD